MLKQTLSPEILHVAKRMVWFKPPEETIAEALVNPSLFLSYVMTYGTINDILVVQKHFTPEAFRKALCAQVPGIFDSRSWAYWHIVFDISPLPPLPTRKL